MNSHLALSSKKAIGLSLGSLIAASSLPGAIVYTADASFTTPAPDDSFPWDVDNSGGTEASWFNSGEFGSIFASVQGGSFRFLGGGSTFPNLTPGYLISSGRSFATYINPVISASFNYATGFTDGVEGIFGFRFTPEGQTLYGWAHIQFDLDNNSANIRDWAYQDDGSAIEAGAVPEPATTAMGLGALALGAAGLSRWRKNRKA